METPTIIDDMSIPEVKEDKGEEELIADAVI